MAENLKSREELMEMRADVKRPFLLIKFTATWCGPCKAMEPVIEKFEKTYPAFRVVSVDVDRFKVLSDDWKIWTVPTLVWMREGQEIHRSRGAISYETMQRYARQMLRPD